MSDRLFCFQLLQKWRMISIHSLIHAIGALWLRTFTVTCL